MAYTLEAQMKNLTQNDGLFVTEGTFYDEYGTLLYWPKMASVDTNPNIIYACPPEWGSQYPYSEPAKEVSIEMPCDHEWQRYVGLTKAYDFCTKCDEKKVD